ncbi:Fur family transcriptional regulator, zinc uptake regulator [Meinhardsimonia xiamenensis]|jgi:Fur family zinc uptake transcriptional regulator|uniref:Fur family transcriptional regulator, zinc uptake regulator n=1 Tax=Meinhardsimonia xiamenensis TaxID=990712 RepID=A0A1G8YXK9_9RHOB|nr:Fur family transcriptional regulator [Meinhardsimonia xiamenensis]PRX37452.1 Fur family zinc uptake transcriptional regulator [Meinhardsimonia xiamenensis]SDK06775.1 Fur family transcriptional regulator, zinc uptake regulator [Meinhardsimonia xiamenensis]
MGNRNERGAPERPQAVLAFSQHDHAACRGAALAAAERVAAQRGARLTPVRRRALEILLEEHRALGAYELLERLAAEGYGHQPPVAYRALDFLVEHGLAHRIRRLNAFAACTCPDAEHAPAFLICRQCNAVAEVAAPRAREGLEVDAAALGFAPERVMIEALGLCPACDGGEADR